METLIGKPGDFALENRRFCTLLFEPSPNQFNVTFCSPRSATRCRATRSMGSEMSTPTTRPASPSAEASGSVSAPVPQPISRTLSPPPMGKRASNREMLSWFRRSLNSGAAAQRGPATVFQ